MATRQILKMAMAGAVVALAACTDSTGSAGASDPGSVSFSYSGARAGTYTANGRFERSGAGFVKRPFAVGVRSTASGVTALSLLSYVPVTTSTGDMILVAVPSVTPGSFDLDPESCDDPGTCPFAAVIFGTNPDVEEDDSQLFTFTSGTLTITSNAGGRATGTFSGTAASFSSDSVITITGGSFDVPVRSDAVMVADRVAAVRAPLLQRAKP